MKSFDDLPVTFRLPPATIEHLIARKLNVMVQHLEFGVLTSYGEDNDRTFLGYSVRRNQPPTTGPIGSLVRAELAKQPITIDLSDIAALIEQDLDLPPLSLRVTAELFATGHNIIGFKIEVIEQTDA